MNVKELIETLKEFPDDMPVAILRVDDYDGECMLAQVIEDGMHIEEVVYNPENEAIWYPSRQDHKDKFQRQDALILSFMD